MFRALSLSFAIAFLADLSQLRAAQLAAPPSFDAKKLQRTPERGLVVEDATNVFRSVRIVRDLAAFKILSLGSKREGGWIVAGVHPGGLSGTLHNQGSYIQAETGKVIDRAIRPKLVILVGGQWKRIDLLSGTAPRGGRYQWKEPYRNNDFDRDFKIYDYYSVFTGPKNAGPVICQFFEDRSGADQFKSVTAIPDDWKTFVKPAYEYLVHHSADFVDSDLIGLMKMASGENPFVALTAICHLLSNSTPSQEIDRLVDLATSLPKYRQAVLTFWLLNRNDDDSRDIILKAISRSKNAHELTGMALGIESWTASQGQPLFDPDPTRHFRDKVMERWTILDPSTNAAEPCKSWNKLLVVPGILDCDGETDETASAR